MEVSETLPDPSKLSASVLDYLDQHFQTYDDFAKAPELASSLENECLETKRNLDNIDSNIREAVFQWASHSLQIRSLLQDLTHTIETNLSPAKGIGSKTSSKNEQILVEDLPQLAREVASVEKVRIYAETTIQLEALVGDLEDAVSSAMAGNSRKISSRKLLNSSDFEPREQAMMLSRYPTVHRCPAHAFTISHSTQVSCSPEGKTNSGLWYCEKHMRERDLVSFPDVAYGIPTKYTQEMNGNQLNQQICIRAKLESMPSG